MSSGLYSEGEDTPVPVLFHRSPTTSSTGSVGTRPPTGKFEVLLVEDDPAESRRIRGLLLDLEQRAFEVKVAGLLSEALDHLATGHVDVVLLDMSLPDSQGIGTLRRILDRDPKPPCVALFDNDDRELMAEAALAGAQDCLIKKQLDPELLARSLRFAIERMRRKKAERSVARTQYELVQQERLRALGTMASGIAHDFNNSLTPILGYSEMLLSAPDLPEKMRRPLDMILTSAQDAAHVVEQLRLFYHQPSPDEHLTPVNLHDMMLQIPDITRPKWRDAAQRTGQVIDLKLDVEETPCSVGNPWQLRELITNLVLNSVDAMPRGGCITLRLRSLPPFNVLEVSDTGSGMTEEVRQRCFEPFFTTKGATGTGLGLSLCHGIVQRHGGRIEIETALGRGTTFRVFLPADQTPPSMLAESVKIDLPTLRVLYIDDDPRVRTVISDMLKQLGQNVDLAETGAAGLAKFSSNDYDLVITDLGMPDMHGYDVVSCVKSSRPTIPVIMLTGWGKSLSEEKVNEPIEPDFTLAKPPTLAMLCEAIARVTAQTRS